MKNVKDSDAPSHIKDFINDFKQSLDEIALYCVEKHRDKLTTDEFISSLSPVILWYWAKHLKEIAPHLANDLEFLDNHKQMAINYVEQIKQDFKDD